MRWIFVDEQIEKGKFGQFFSLTFVAILEEQLASVRENLIVGLRPIFQKTPNVIPRFPVLHGSNLLREFSDDDKLSAIGVTIRVLRDHGLKIGRVGYFNKDFQGAIEKSRSLAHFSIMDLALRAFSDELVFVSELDLSSHAELSLNYNDFQHQYLRHSLSPAELSLPYERVFGKYYCDKENHWMQLTDLTSYLLWTNDRISGGVDLSEFRKSLAAMTQEISHLVVYSDIVQTNDPFPNECTGPNGFRPIQYTVPITPSDTEDLSTQFNRFRDKLVAVWKMRNSRN